MNAKLRIDFNQEMYVVRHDFEFKNVGLMLRRHFADQFFEPRVGAIDQDFAPLFRAPDDVIFTRADDVSIRFAVHETSISHVYCILCGGKKEQGSRARRISPELKQGALRRFQVNRISSVTDVCCGEVTECLLIRHLSIPLLGYRLP